MKGLEFGARLEFRCDRFTFQISDFWGYDDLPTLDTFNTFERRVDPNTGEPLDIVGNPLLGQSPERSAHAPGESAALRRRLLGDQGHRGDRARQLAASRGRLPPRHREYSARFSSLLAMYSLTQIRWRSMAPWSRISHGRYSAECSLDSVGK